MSTSRRSGREISYAQAIGEAIRQEMERDPGVFVYGPGVEDPALLDIDAGRIQTFGQSVLMWTTTCAVLGKYSCKR